MKLAAVKAGRGLTERSACKRLAALAAAVPRDHAIVELGAYQGRTTAWLAWGSHRGDGARVWSIDPWGLLEEADHPDYAEVWEHHYRDGAYAADETFDSYLQHLAHTGAARYVQPVRSYAAAAGHEWAGPPVALLWHDAQHTAEAVQADLLAWLPHLTGDAVIALHDVCQPAYGVLDGARAALDPAEWGTGTIHPWAKASDRRGMAVFRRC